ncbi:MAG: hypothetical protein NZ732_00735 [Candidatus Poseidoniales archaeon]|jgi:hypothetical protein|nr:hypothetical protein [Euryarchaeota archaeon]MCS5529254.1 hypothetical protein [Candidatus Poseidoniales archaeon]MDP6562775.1 hypothetical protein [Candidatus Thalassarchaeum sp.]MEC8913978.1 hypothetical protein [Candidatus Thermoplasmatota archaeon]MDP6921145.1 hypothetical protein [Candidatus Thalassarchaeum sp.]|tara:strand:+ start:783 stop:1061 length:279 start_codon:yes stop_codon:yes gene_type:complete
MSEGGSGTVGEFIQGEDEPSSSWVILAFGLVTSLALLVLHGILYPGRDLPVISEILPVFEGVFDSGIWFFILGVMIGVFAIIATMMTEATSE